MLLLASTSSAGADRYARFQNREEVGIIPFSSEPSRTVLFPMGGTPEENSRARAQVAEYVKPMQPGGSTAIYSSVQQALVELSQERSRAQEKRYYTVVLMTDGENNRGLSKPEFVRWYRSRGETVRGIPVFPILFGEGSARDLGELADLTGGRLFDSRSNTLTAVFKEIRGYQ
jgi:Ca-activated chloride channel family protein